MHPREGRDPLPRGSQAKGKKQLTTYKFLYVRTLCEREADSGQGHTAALSFSPGPQQKCQQGPISFPVNQNTCMFFTEQGLVATERGRALIHLKMRKLGPNYRKPVSGGPKIRCQVLHAQPTLPHGCFQVRLNHLPQVSVFLGEMFLLFL